MDDVNTQCIPKCTRPLLQNPGENTICVCIMMNMQLYLKLLMHDIVVNSNYTTVMILLGFY